MESFESAAFPPLARDFQSVSYASPVPCFVYILSSHEYIPSYGHCGRRRVQVRGVEVVFSSTITRLNPHSYSLTVFSPSGKLVQIEHALAAVSQGTTSLGIKGDVSFDCVSSTQSFQHILRSFEWDSHRNREKVIIYPDRRFNAGKGRRDMP